MGTKKGYNMCIVATAGGKATFFGFVETYG